MEMGRERVSTPNGWIQDGHFSSATGIRDTASDLGFTPTVVRAGSPLMWTRSGSVGNNLKSLTIYLRGSRQNQQPIEENMFLSESTVRTSLKITSAVAAALAFSLAGAGSALADTIGADASGGGDVGFDVSGPPLPPPPPLPALPAPTASASGGTGVGVDTPLGSADGGVQTGFGVGLPTLPPPPPLPSASASGSAQTNLGFGF
jgi:hypothetical protein